MIDGLVAKRYAKALFEVANAKNLLDKVEEDLQIVVKVVDEDQELMSFLRHPRISTDVKKELLNSAFNEQVDEISKNLLFQLVDNHRIEFISEILRQYVILANEARNIVDVAAITAIQLDDADQTAITELFANKLGKKIRLINLVDPTIIGGMIIKIGDRVYDGSLSTQLKMMKQKIIASRV